MQRGSWYASHLPPCLFTPLLLKSLSEFTGHGYTCASDLHWINHNEKTDCTLLCNYGNCYVARLLKYGRRRWQRRRKNGSMDAKDVLGNGLLRTPDRERFETMVRFIYFCAAALVLTIGGTVALYMMDGVKAERASIAARDTQSAHEDVAALGGDVTDGIEDEAAALNAIETAAGADVNDGNGDFGAAFTDVAPPALQDGKSVLPVAEADVGMEAE